MKYLRQIISETQLILTSVTNRINEKTDDAKTPGSVSQDTHGKMHEILTGYHLNAGKHMTHHVNKIGETPQQTHDRLKKQIHPSDYSRINAAAKSAASHIHSHIKKTHPDHIIHAVTHTSKTGDTERVTGHKATQTQDSSDIYVTTKHPKTGKVVHHGISLKTSEGANKHVPVSNPGIEHAGSKAPEALQKHREGILKSHPQLQGKNKAERKAIVKSNPALASELKQKHQKFLQGVASEHAKELQGHLSSGNRAHVVNHLRTIMHAHSTPAQAHGHEFFKHTTYQTSQGTQHHISNPSKDHEHILKDPKNISVSSSGSYVHFHHKDKKFASQSVKMDSQSDPLSHIKGVGHVHQ